MIRVFVNGSFDILHPGHIQLLNTAKSLGDHLTVAIDTDARIARLKGPGRPINYFIDRLIMISNIKAVDDVSFFETDDELASLIKSIQPHIMVKGADYKNKKAIGEEYCGAVHYVDLTGHSTTQIVERISSRRRV